MEFGILGPVAARSDGRDLPLGGPKQRALLAILLLHANEPVSRDRLIDGIWGAAAPPTVGHTLDNYVSRLRKALGDGRLVRRPPGYLLRVDAGELDLDRFEQLLGAGRARLAAGDAAAAVDSLRSALALWRGAALADLVYEPFAQGEAERLEERRLIAVEARIEAELALGGGADLVRELETLVAVHPFRERLLSQLMLALYRAGRQADALDAYDSARKRLAGELGLDPGPEVQELQRRILAHDAGLASGPARRAPPRRRRRLPLLASTGTAIAVAASVAIGLVLGTGGTSASSGAAASTRLVALDPSSGGAKADTTLDAAPSAMVAGYGSLWLAQPDASAVARVDLDTRKVVDRIPVRLSPAALAAGGGSVWAAAVPGERLIRIDPRTGAVTEDLDLGAARASALAFESGRLWIADIAGESLLALDPVSGTRRTFPLPFRPTALAAADGVVWVADYEGSAITDVDASTGRTLTTIRVGSGPAALAFDGRSVWVVNTLDSTVSEVDPASSRVVATTPVGSGPAAVAVAGGSVWVANRYSASVSRIDRATAAVVETRSAAGGPTTLAVAAGSVWVGVRPVTQHRGGTLVLLHTRPISVDPALQTDLLPPVSNSLTRDGLLTFDQSAGSAGIQLVPDLALNVPVPTDGGTTYTFRLRSGIRYSDGRLVTAADFRRAIERLFRLGAQTRTYFDGIRGSASCGRAACDLSRGVVTDDAARTVTFHLEAADPDFLTNLADSRIATPVPPGTPFHDVGWKPVPGTGPYEIAHAGVDGIRLVRNPRFHEWSHAAQPAGNPDQILLRFGLSADAEVRAIEAGRADWMGDMVPRRFLPLLRTRFPSRLHRWSIPTTDFFQFNATLPPFDDVRVRRAFNFALDRRAIVRMYGGPDLATATCQVLPPGTRGHRAYCPYTRHPRRDVWTAPDLARARRLVAASGTRGTPVTLWAESEDPSLRPPLVRYAATVLRRLGYPTRVRLVRHAFFEHAPPRAYARIQIVTSAWGDTPYGFFGTWFKCGGPFNHHWFCDRTVDREIQRARLLPPTDVRAAAASWARLDRDVTDRAAWAPIVDEHVLDFVSGRLRNYQAHPYWGFLPAQAWLR